MNKNLLLGIDGGGTYIRAAVTDTDGILLSCVKYRGTACKRYDPNAKNNFHNAVNEAIVKAGCTLGDIAGATAGLAGYDGESDLEWVREVTDIDGLKCTLQTVNDTVVAQKGAFLSKPGIIAISGTGSQIFGINEAGEHVSNYNFGHFAYSASMQLSFQAVYKIITGETDETDIDLINTVFKYFNVKYLSELIRLGIKGFVEDWQEKKRLFGNLAPAVTEAALNGSRLARKICGSAAAEIITGIKLVGACFGVDDVPVGLIGSVANHVLIKNEVKQILSADKKYCLTEPALPAVLGAVFMAMRHSQISVDEQTLQNLYKSAEMIKNDIY